MYQMAVDDTIFASYHKSNTSQIGRYSTVLTKPLHTTMQRNGCKRFVYELNTRQYFGVQHKHTTTNKTLFALIQAPLGALEMFTLYEHITSLLHVWYSTNRFWSHICAGVTVLLRLSALLVNVVNSICRKNDFVF